MVLPAVVPPLGLPEAGLALLLAVLRAADLLLPAPPVVAPALEVLLVAVLLLLAVLPVVALVLAVLLVAVLLPALVVVALVAPALLEAALVVLALLEAVLVVLALLAVALARPLAAQAPHAAVDHPQQQPSLLYTKPSPRDKA